ncbi:hypothetical protein CH063_12994 [Colletotrichum higginsianum]|uniref:Uncharacterized protein n=1 Tax=Colletotrichum higginsianum (strain IMI 349063) TaxID=759273 RepID=H1VSM6_COLHI|nr:hypothetical protein CH063_12994 [Colletotrichum higginsianum]
MHFVKSIFLLGLLAVQSLAGPVRVPRNEKNSALAAYVAARDEPVGKRAAPPADFVDWPAGEVVDMSAHGSARRGEALNDDNDKFLAHISAVNWQAQLNRLYEATDLSSPRVRIFVPRPVEGPMYDIQNSWNEDVISHINGQWGEDYSIDVKIRDGSRNDDVGGSRLWIDGNNNVHWSVTGQVI